MELENTNPEQLSPQTLQQQDISSNNKESDQKGNSKSPFTRILTLVVIGTPIGIILIYTFFQNIIGYYASNNILGSVGRAAGLIFTLAILIFFALPLTKLFKLSTITIGEKKSILTYTILLLASLIYGVWGWWFVPNPLFFLSLLSLPLFISIILIIIVRTIILLRYNT